MNLTASQRQRNVNNILLYSTRLQCMKEMQQQQMAYRSKYRSGQKQKRLETMFEEQHREKKLKQTVQKTKIRMLVHEFANKITRYAIHGSPPNFTEFKSAKLKKAIQEESLSGIQLPEKVQFLVTVFYIFGLIICYYLSTFQAFIHSYDEHRVGRSDMAALLKTLATLLFSLQILRKLFQTKNKHGLETVSLHSITMANLKSISFYIKLGTLVSSILFTFWTTKSMGIAMFIVCILNVKVVADIVGDFYLIFAGNFYTKQYSKLVFLFLFNVFFAHLVASILLSITFLEGPGKGWQAKANIVEQDWYIQYIWSFYWAVNIMMTIGFGDYSATTWKEATIVAFLEIFAAITLAYIISEVAIIINDIRVYSRAVEQDIGVFRRMVKQNHIPNDLKYQIMSYIQQSTEIKKKYQFAEQKKLLQRLPSSLKTAYLSEANKEIFQKLPFFALLSKTSTLIHFANKIEGKVFYPTEIMLKKNTYIDNIIILRNGQVGLSYKKSTSVYNGIILQRLSTQYSENPILLNVNMFDLAKELTVDIVSQNYAVCYTLSFQEFLEGLKEFQLDHEYYFHILHRHSLTEHDWGFGYVCEYCRSYQLSSNLTNSKNTIINSNDCSGSLHTVFQCPRLHFVPLKDHVVRKHIAKPVQGNKMKRSHLVSRQSKRREFHSPIKMWKNVFKQWGLSWGIPNQTNVTNRGRRQSKFYQLNDFRFVMEPWRQFQRNINSPPKKPELASKISIERSALQSARTINLPINEQKKLTEMIEQGVQEVLHRHFNEHELNPEDNESSFNVDSAYNYTEYFLTANPSRLIQFPLGKSNRQKTYVVKFMQR